MRDDFPHLDADGANVFPDNVEPRPYIQYRNEFDYTKWDEGSIVRLLSVDWDGVRDNPWFTSIEARDKWFSDNADVSVTLTVSANMRGDDIKLPIPYDVAQQYNYLTVTLPAYPVARETDDGTRTFCFHIDHSDYSAPNTTVFRLDVDWWTTYVNKVDIQAVMLAQGHWAVAHSATVADYLSSPITHTVNLLDNEGDTFTGVVNHDAVRAFWNTGDMKVVIDTGGVDNTNPSGYSLTQTTYPFYSSTTTGERYTTDAGVAYAREVPMSPVRPYMSYAYPDIPEVTDANPLPDFTAHDVGTTDRVYQRGMVTSQTPEGAHFKWGGEHGSPICEMMAVNPADMNTFMANAPIGFWETVRAVYIVPTRFLSLSAGVTVFGVTCNPVVDARNDAYDVTLTTDDFAYSDDAAKWTKLYTGQYARVYLTASDGREISIPPETLGDVTQLTERMQITQDGMRILCTLDGVGCDTNLEFVRINRMTEGMNVGVGGEWQKTVMEFDIPTYAVWQSANDNATWRKGPEREQARWDMWLASDKSMKDGDAERFTADAAAWQTWRNALGSNAVNATNATMSAEAACDNTTANAQAGENATEASTETAYNNVLAGTANSKANLTKMNDCNTNTLVNSQLAALNNMHSNMRYQMAIAGITPPGDDVNGVGGRGTANAGVPGTTVWKLVQDTRLDYQKFHDLQQLAISQAVDGVGVTAVSSITGNAVAGGQNAATGFVAGYNSIGKPANVGAQFAAGAINAAGNILGAAANVGVGVMGASLNLGLEVSKISGTEDIQRDYVYGASNSIDTSGMSSDGKLNVELSRLLLSNWYERELANTNYNQNTATETANLETANNTNIAINDATCLMQNTTAANSMGTANENADLQRSVTVRTAQRARDVQTGGSNPAAEFQTHSYADGVRDTEYSMTVPAWDTGVGNIKRTRDNADSTATANWYRAFYNQQDHWYWVTYPDAIIDAWNANMRIRAGEVADSRGAAVMFGANTGEATGAEVLPQGVTVRVTRPLDGDVQRISDRFTRYGYMCHRYIENPVLFEKWDDAHAYEYWRCSEVWVRANRNAPQRAVNMIKSCLVNGITVISMEA